MIKRFALFVIISFSIYYGFSQEVQWEMDTVKKYEVPVGLCSWEELKGHEFYNEMSEQYAQYLPNPKVMEELSKQLFATSLHVDIYFGAWCGDSREHVPHFMKIHDDLLNNFGILLDYQIIGCNREKECGATNDEIIEYVPTLIIYKVDDSGNYPIGKIIETPEITLEEDLLKILHP
ncbi:MAG: hypothetical protein M0P38_00140 [Bacteroidales bacterium]|jgi:hypothetical protein|nr:hypothetical protein [Bacteroidales bacterium]